MEASDSGKENDCVVTTADDKVASKEGRIPRANCDFRNLCKSASHYCLHCMNKCAFRAKHAALEFGAQTSGGCSLFLTVHLHFFR